MNYPTSLWNLENSVSATLNNKSPAIAVGPDDSLYYVKVYKNIPPTGPIPDPEVFPDYYPVITEISGNAYFYQIEVGKVSQFGVLQWKFTDPRFETLAENDDPSIVVGASGEIFIAFVTNGSIPLHYNLASIPSFCPNNCAAPGTEDIVLVRIADHGTSASIVWLKQDATVNSCNRETCPRLAIDTTKNVFYLTWACSSTIQCYTPYGTNNIILACFTYSGTQLWIEATYLLNGTGTNISPTIATDSLQNVYVAWLNNGLPDMVSFHSIFNGSIYTSHSRNWQLSDTTALSSTGTCYTPTIASDSTGNTFLAYLTNSRNTMIVTTISQNGIQGWEQTYTDISNATWPYLTTDKYGNPYLSLTTNSGTIVRLYRFSMLGGEPAWVSTAVPSMTYNYYGYAMDNAPFHVLHTDPSGAYAKTPIAIYTNSVYTVTSVSPAISIPSEAHTAIYNDLVISAFKQVLYVSDKTAFQYMTQNKLLCSCNTNNCGC